MDPVPAPEFRDLEHGEMEAMLRAHRVGRIGYLSGGHVDIQPIGYVGVGAIHLRTTEGTKADAPARQQPSPGAAEPAPGSIAMLPSRRSGPCRHEQPR